MQVAGPEGERIAAPCISMAHLRPGGQSPLVWWSPHHINYFTAGLKRPQFLPRSYDFSVRVQGAVNVDPQGGQRAFDQTFVLFWQRRRKTVRNSPPGFCARPSKTAAFVSKQAEVKRNFIFGAAMPSCWASPMMSRITKSGSSKRQR